MNNFNSHLHTHYTKDPFFRIDKTVKMCYNDYNSVTNRNQTVICMKKHFTLKKAAAICAAMCIALSAFSGRAQDKSAVRADNTKYDEQLDELRKQQADLDAKIAEADEKLAAEEDNFNALQEKYDAINEKIENASSYTHELELEMAELDSQQLESSYNVQQMEDSIKEQTSNYLKRIRALYIAGGSSSYANLLVDSADFYDVLMRIELMTRVAKHDNEELESLLDDYSKLKESKAKLDEQIKALNEKTAEYSDKQAELAEQQAELLRLEQESGALLSELRKDRSELGNSYDELNSEYAQVSQAADAATAAATTTTTAKPAEQTAETTRKTTATEEDTTPTETKATTVQTQATTQQTTKATTQETTKATTKATEAPAPVPSGDSNKINTVLAYAKSNVGGSYVWGGASFKACDCSGLVMLSFAQVGINLPHYAASQAEYGTTVSYNNIQPGDVVFFGGSNYSSIYHVGIYIGDGLMVHAQNSATGIVISNLANFSYWGNPITVIKRLI